MNRIVFAGTIENPSEERINKYFEFIVPEAGGNGGYIAAAAPAGNEERDYISFGRGEIAVIPPYFRYKKIEYGANDVHILIEQAMLPIKEILTMTDVENCGIRHAAVQAAEFYASGYDKKEAVLSALGNLLVSYVTLVLGEGKKYSPVVTTVLTGIEKNLSDCMYSLDDEIRKLPLNYDYVRKLFKKETGATPHEFLVAKRMERARSLLISGITNQYSNYSVSQVAEACGFAEPLYFSRVFKKYYGIAPSVYAKKKD